MPTTEMKKATHSKAGFSAVVSERVWGKSKTITDTQGWAQWHRDPRKQLRLNTFTPYGTFLTQELQQHLVLVTPIAWDARDHLCPPLMYGKVKACSEVRWWGFSYTEGESGPPSCSWPFPDDSRLKRRWFLGKVQLWKDLDSLWGLQRCLPLWITACVKSPLHHLYGGIEHTLWIKWVRVSAGRNKWSFTDVNPAWCMQNHSWWSL